MQSQATCYKCLDILNSVLSNSNWECHLRNTCRCLRIVAITYPTDIVDDDVQIADEVFAHMININ